MGGPRENGHNNEVDDGDNDQVDFADNDFDDDDNDDDFSDDAKETETFIHKDGHQQERKVDGQLRHPKDSVGRPAASGQQSKPRRFTVTAVPDEQLAEEDQTSPGKAVKVKDVELDMITSRQSMTDDPAVAFTFPAHLQLKQTPDSKVIGVREVKATLVPVLDQGDKRKKTKTRRKSSISMCFTDEELEMTRAELIAKYRLHGFVALIFLVTVLSVSLSWYYRRVAEEMLHSSRAIFFNPRTRQLTLADPSRQFDFQGRLGLDMPLWQLPLHCPLVLEDRPHEKECEWKKNAILRIKHFGNDEVHCYNVSWESLHPEHVPYDCFDLGDAKWYGPGNQSATSFPIIGSFSYQPTNYTLRNNGLFNTVVDFYWLSSHGVAIRVNPDNPMQVHWNRAGDNQLCLLSNYTGPFYHQKNVFTAPHMDYTLCNGLDPLTTHMYLQSMPASTDKVNLPPAGLMDGPHWSLKAVMETDNLTQEHVLDLADKVTSHGFQNNKLTLDGNWQGQHGDLTFDPHRFNNLSAMGERLAELGCHVTVCISPYFHYTSRNFHKGVSKSMFVKDAGGEVTGLTNFQGGLSAVLDTFGQEGRNWYRQQLKDLVVSVPEIKSHRLTYGAQAWLPYKPHFQLQDGTPNMFRKLLTETLGSVTKSLIVEHTAESRHVTSLIPVVTEVGEVGGRKCLTGAIEKALTLGLMGYPFIMADGLTVLPSLVPDLSGVSDGRPSRELYTRWLQLAAIFPAHQFSIPPWTYDDATVAIATNLSAKVRQVVLNEFKDEELVQEVGRGLPIMRPVWWLDPANQTVHAMEIKDQFLVGDNLLAAPVLCEGVTSRDIYVPPGVWEDLSQGHFILGPKTMSDYRVQLSDVPLFKRRQVLGADSRADL